MEKQPELILSDREKNLQLSVKGLSNTEIGETLFIDANTVKFHKKKIFEKLHAENITEGGYRSQSEVDLGNNVETSAK